MDALRLLIKRILYAGIEYIDEGMMFGLYLMMLILIYFVFKDSKIKKSFVLPALIFLGFIYLLLPLSNHNVVETYVRFFWLLLTHVVTAIGFTYMICRTESRKKRAAFIAVLIPVFIVCGAFQIADYLFEPAENLYRLPQYTVNITEKVLSEKDSPRLVVPFTIAHPFRQISTDVYLLYGEDATYGRITRTSADLIKVSDEMLCVTPDLNYICEKMDEYDCDYIVFDTVYTEFCENGNINVNHYPAGPTFVGAQPSTVSFEDLKEISVIGTESEPYWDLSAYDLEYDGTFERYILYRKVN